MWRHGEGAKEEIEGINVMWPRLRAALSFSLMKFCSLGQLILRLEVQKGLLASSVRERFRPDNFCVPSCFRTPVTFFYLLQDS